MILDFHSWEWYNVSKKIVRENKRRMISVRVTNREKNDKKYLTNTRRIVQKSIKRKNISQDDIQKYIKELRYAKV